MKKIIDKFIEQLLKVSSFISTATIIFIIVFLFKEGFGLFNAYPIEPGYTIIVNSNNIIKKLEPLQIKKIFDLKIKNWNEVGGEKLNIKALRIDDIIKASSQKELGNNYENLQNKVLEIVKVNKGIIAYLPLKYLPENSKLIKQLNVNKISIVDFLLGKNWLPTSNPSQIYGVLPLILGTLLVSFIAILIAVPLGLGVAVYLSEVASYKMRKILSPTIELLAGIPSVVYGFFGLVVLVPIIQKSFNLAIGENVLTGSIVLAIMAIPTIIKISEDAIRNTPQSIKNASYALGANQWQTITKVTLPYATSGINTAILLGIGRAIGETMAVLMVTGNAAVMPKSIFEPIRTIPATIAAELGEAPNGGTHYQSLFLLACALFLITLIINIVSTYISNKEAIKE